MTKLLLRLHGWAARRKYGILCSFIRLAIVILEGAPQDVVDMEMGILRRKLAAR
jgi:hypothetical protein